MPPRKKRDATPNEERAVDYRYSGEKRTNIPPARIAGEGAVPTVPKARYAYSPHLPPTLQFDPTGEPDKLDALVDKATKGALSTAEATRLKEALRVKEPTLEWAGKREQREKGFLEVDPVALHIHERVSARAIIRSALREDVQRDLFADPQQPYKEAVQFYKHDVDWANRLILGDSLQVMSSLARRENLAGKVQMIYMDPPYGIKFASNFQSEIRNRDVKEKEQDLTREPEMIRAYRDTWTLGVHSYLTYLRDRLLVCRELLANTGSIFVQISDENLHRVRALLDEVFGPSNFVAIITYAKTTSTTGDELGSVNDYILWYWKSAKDAPKPFKIFKDKRAGEIGGTGYTRALLPNGETVRLSTDTTLPVGARVFASDNLVSSKPPGDFAINLWGRERRPKKGYWKTGAEGMKRLIEAERVYATEDGVGYVRLLEDFAAVELTNIWTDTVGQNQFGAAGKIYSVQTANVAVQRCMMMVTKPGDLVLDPTCGSGTTAVVAEQWGRRWITIDTSRVAISVARQRLVTAKFDHYRLNSQRSASSNPSEGFVYRTVPRVTLKSIATNHELDAVFDRHRAGLHAALEELNAELERVSADVRASLRQKLEAKERSQGKRSVTEGDRRRLLLPSTRWDEWQVPFDADPSWPASLAVALEKYRALWAAKMNDVNESVSRNAEQVELVDQPVKERGVLRVAGPFSVEGVQPEALSLDEAGLFDGTPNQFEAHDDDEDSFVQQHNVSAYLERMVQLIRQDGITFLGNRRRQFAIVEPLFDAGTGTMLHAEGAWSDAESSDVLDVAIGFGPQYGPVTAQQVETLIRSTKRHKDLVIAGFSFDADATAMIQEQSHPKLRIHQAYIRPDVNPGMDGLLKDTPNSQLFTVFGTPEIELTKTKDGEHVVELKGVDIYDPVANTVRSTGADKVAAWFLDSDFDGRCFCVTQAFFPDQDAWEKIAKALGSAADADAFEAFKGTSSIPFSAGTHKRIAVKVIDPRGNEVMVVRSLEA